MKVSGDAARAVGKCTLKLSKLLLLKKRYWRFKRLCSSAVFALTVTIS